MPRFQSDSDARRLGEALAVLRRERGLSQAEAGRRAGMTSQGWGLYETGKRSGLYRPDVQRRLTTALGATPADLTRPEPTAHTAHSFPGMASEGRTFLHDVDETRRLQMSNDDLAPWAASGVVVEYAPGRWPRCGQGCVIEMAGGEILVRLYEEADSKSLTVRGGSGGLARRDRILRAEVRAVSAVVARLEP